MLFLFFINNLLFDRIVTIFFNFVNIFYNNDNYVQIIFSQQGTFCQ